jgi:L-asparaginase/Glu-tRNA(Gln) amidotransferase subunit D
MALDGALESDSPVRAVVIQSLGAGNIPTEDPYDLTPLIRRARDLGVPVFLTSQYPVDVNNMGRYPPPKSAIRAGAVPIANMAMGALMAKLSWALGKTRLRDGEVDQGRLRKMMWTNYLGEVDEADSLALQSIFQKNQD